MKELNEYMAIHIFFFAAQLIISPVVISGVHPEITDKTQLKGFFFGACTFSQKDNLDTKQRKQIKRQRKLVSDSVEQWEDKRRDTSKDYFDSFISSDQAERLHRKSAYYNYTNLEKALRGAGVNINAQSKKSWNTPIISAALNEHWDMVDTLIDVKSRRIAPTDNISYKNVLGLIVRSKSIKKNCDGVIKIVLEKILNEAHKLCRYGYDTSFFAEAFIKLGKHCTTDVFQVAKDAIPFDQHHPLRKKHVAEEIFSQALDYYSSEKSGKISILLGLKDSKGKGLIDPNQKVKTVNVKLSDRAEYRKLTPLMYACIKKNSAVAKELLKNGEVKKKINMGDIRGWTAYSHSKSQDVTKMLLENGADQIYGCGSRVAIPWTPDYRYLKAKKNG